MKKIIPVLCFCTLQFYSVKANIEETLFLNDGTPYKGYICKQDFVNMEMTFLVEDGLRDKEIVFAYDSVQYVNRSVRDKDQLTGVDDVFVLRDGDKYQRYQGQMVRQSIKDGTVEILCKGKKEVLSLSKVVSQGKESVFKNKGLTLFDQAPFIETIKLKSGETIKGVIVEQKEGLLVIAFRDRVSTVVRSEEVASFSRERNKGCVVINKSNIGEKDVYIGDQKLMPKEDFCISDDVYKASFSAEKDIVPVFIKDVLPEKKLKVRVYDPDGIKRFSLIPLKKEKNEEKKLFGKTQESSYLCFSYGDIVIKQVLYTIKDMANDERVFEFNAGLIDSGYYALYDYSPNEKGKFDIYIIELK